MRLATISAAVLLAFTASTAFAARTAAPEVLANVHTVAVMSGVGDEITLKTIGFTAFGNRLEKLEVSDWKLDHWIAERTGQALSTRFTVKPAPAFDRTALAPAHFLGYAGVKSLKPVLPQLGGEGIDAYLVVRSAQEQLYPTNQYFEGLGILRMTGPFGKGGEAIKMSTVWLTLADAKTGDTLVERQMVCPLERNPKREPMWAMREWKDAPQWVVTGEPVTPDRKPVLEQAIKSAYAVCVDRTLSKMGLAVEAAP